MEKKLKVAIIGVGNIAQFHIAAYKKLSNVEVYAFCDIDEENLKLQGEKHGVNHLYTDMDKMFEELPEIDIVNVCTWNVHHAKCSIAALNAGKHVLCEKPMAMNAQEAAEMKAAADKNNKLLMIGFVRRHGQDCKILKDYVDNDYLGEIYYVKTTYLRRNGNPMGWFADKELSGGGPLIDLGVHVIDFTRYIMGNPKPVAVYGVTYQKLIDNRKEIKDKRGGHISIRSSKHDNCNVEDLVSAFIKYDNGATVAIEASFNLNIKDNKGEIEFFGTKGGAKIDPSLEIFNETNGYMSNISLCTNTALNFDGIFDSEINHFVSCVLGEEECLAPAEDGIEIMRILDAIYESAAKGCEIKL